MSLLTLYCPTFERHELATCVESIVPQLTPEVRFVVSDNSPTGYGERLCDPPVEYSRRHYNIGGDPNVLRGATEPCEYLWVIGDDDVLLPGAVENVLDAIVDDRPDRIVLTTPEVKMDAFSGSVRDWIRGLADWSVLIATTLITSNVYRTAVLDLDVGLRKLDSHYPLSWAAIGAQTVNVVDEPAFNVGVHHQVGLPEAPVVWQDYLNGLAYMHDIPDIPVSECVGWNFNLAALREAMRMKKAV